MGEGAKTHDGLRIAAVLTVTCVCGWLVMQMEILGGRVLAPYFGSAVYVVMGSVIGVFLLSLSVGYMLGGWLSRRPDSPVILGIGLLLAGAWFCGMPFAVDPLCEAVLARELGMEWGSLLAALGLFGVPTALLGMVSPTAVRWLTRQASDSGLKAGLVLALSTLASFAGCIVTAFYLVVLSVRWTITVSGVVLLLLGIGVLAARRMLVPPCPEDARVPPAGPGVQ